MKRISLILVIVAAVAVAVLAAVWLTGSAELVDATPPSRHTPVNAESHRVDSSSIPLRHRRDEGVASTDDVDAEPHRVAPAVEEPTFTPAEQKTVDAIQDALDDDDLKKVSAQLQDAAASTNAAVRAKAVEALQWFGVKALPELTMFMADEDEDVRTSAIDAWTAGVSQMDAGDEKAKTVQLGMSVVTDRGQLESLVMQVDDLTDLQKLTVLTQIIEGKNKTAADVAREHYKFWTEEDYTDLATAQKWLDAQSKEDVQ